MSQILKKIVVFLIIFNIAGSGLYAYDPNSEEFQNVTDQLVCYLCGCGWVLSTCRPENCEYSKELRERIGNFLDEGYTEKEVIQSMIGIYGERILGAPLKRGFNWSAYLLPFIVLLVGGICVVILADRWTRPGPKNQDHLNQNEDPDEESSRAELVHRERIEAELEEFDRSSITRNADR